MADSSNTRRSRPRSCCSTGGGLRDPRSGPRAASARRLHAPPGVRDPEPGAPKPPWRPANWPAGRAGAPTPAPRSRRLRALPVRDQYGQVAHRTGASRSEIIAARTGFRAPPPASRTSLAPPWKHPAATGVGDRGGGEGRKRRDQAGPVAFRAWYHAFHEPLDERAAEHFAPGRLGRRAMQERVLKELRQQVVVHFAGRRQLTVRVERPAAVRGEFRSGVDERDARARIEGQDGLAVRGCGEPGHVGHPAQILEGARPVGRGEEQAVRPGHEGCAVPTGCHVAGPEVAHHRYAGDLRDGRGIPQLEGSAAGVPGRGVVPHRLSVRTDRRDPIPDPPRRARTP